MGACDVACFFSDLSRVVCTLDRPNAGPASRTGAVPSTRIRGKRAAGSSLRISQRQHRYQPTVQYLPKYLPALSALVALSCAHLTMIDLVLFLYLGSK